MVELWQSSLAELLPGKKRKSFPFLVGYAVVTGHESSSFWSSGSVLIQGDLFINFTFPSFDQDLWKHHFQFHHFQLLFPSQYKEGPFLGVVSHFEGKCRFKTYWGHIWITRRGRSVISQMLCHYQRFICKLPTSHVWISWENCLIRCHLLQLWETFTFMPPDDEKC